MSTANDNPHSDLNGNLSGDNLRITVLYFASLAEKSGMDEELLTCQTHDLGELYQMLAARFGFTLSKDKLAVAVNHHLTTWDTPIRQGDTVAFIPPVAGG